MTEQAIKTRDEAAEPQVTRQRSALFRTAKARDRFQPVEQLVVRFDRVDLEARCA